MAFFGRLVEADREVTCSKPLQLLKKFERTLVGRVLNLEISEAQVKASLAFLPSVWQCEGRVHALR
ncbi:unnamed protein product [Arabis nemorensis]|uniref:DUF4283 domain-containing protein n=1 Tax=Arabis nemorensis TaxID=586526 RepID=A0A565BJ13_9BRAS|nr:unnamed protein product [Arabis nemorensis]